MFSHIQLGARDLPAMIAFYEAVLPEIGLVRITEDEDDGGPDGAGWQMPGMRWPQFYVQLPYNRAPASPGNGDPSKRLCPVASTCASGVESGTRCRGL